MNMLPITKETKLRQRWAEKQERKCAVVKKAGVVIHIDSTVIKHKA